MGEHSIEPRGGSRRLHGVLLADMTGFSRIMGEDEARAVAALMRIRDVFAAVVPRHGGTLDVFVGDCFVALFDSAVEAVHAALAIQDELAAAPDAGGEPVRIRIGIHLGDVVRSGSEILGDSVNVAARVQAIAPPGGITVSEDVFRAVRNRVKAPFRDLGPKSLKNIRGRMRVYALEVEHAGAAAAGAARWGSLRRLALAGAGVALATLAAIALRPHGEGTREGGAHPARAVVARTDPAAVLTVGVTGVSAHGDVPAWMRDTTRDGLNTLLSKVAPLRVFSREKIDFLRERRGLSEIEVAEALGIQKMISGSMAVQDGDVVVEVRVVDIETGLLDASETLRGPADGLIELQNRLAGELIAALGVHLSETEQQALFAQRTRETLEGYRRLAETFGEAGPGPRGASGERTSWWRGGTTTAWAAEEEEGEAAVLELLDAYRAALEREDLEALAAIHVALGEEQRTGFARYFESAEDLRVTISEADVLLDGDEALLTFTRRDAFRDLHSGKEVQLEVRLSTVVVRRDGRWLMRGVKRS
jgi:class 3 adenylate cyclase/TolB-like protein/ketosteroid isomerase-like protein